MTNVSVGYREFTWIKRNNQITFRILRLIYKAILLLENCFIRICDDADQILEESTLGYIQISGKNVTKGY